MKRALIIYDDTGFILSNMSGSVREPVGIPFIWVEIPEGKTITSVDVSVTPNVAILEDAPVSEIAKVQSDITSLFEVIDAILTEILV